MTSVGSALRAALLGTGLAVLSTQGATAQQGFVVDERIAGQLLTMTTISTELCSEGNGKACRAAERLQLISGRMMVAQDRCASGSRRACAAFEEGIRRVGSLYEEFVRANRGRITARRAAEASGEAGSSPFSDGAGQSPFGSEDAFANGDGAFQAE